jgi:hypothetical protein
VTAEPERPPPPATEPEAIDAVAVLREALLDRVERLLESLLRRFRAYRARTRRPLTRKPRPPRAWIARCRG